MTDGFLGADFYSSTADDISIDHLLRQLDQNADEIQSSLDGFVADRELILKNQKLAIAKYEAELLEIEASNPENKNSLDLRWALFDIYRCFHIL
jgi:hypothetical protein